MKKYNLAIEYAKKALESNKHNGFAYCTLAETYCKMGNEEEFYRNAELAMKYGYPAWEEMTEPPYDRYFSQERFKQMVKKYKK